MTAPQPDDASEPESRYVLRLFVTGATQRSTRAITNLRHVLEREVPGRYDLEVIDIYHYPERARDHQVFAAPTLVKLFPEPVRRIIGDLSDEPRLLLGLGIQRAEGEP